MTTTAAFLELSAAHLLAAPKRGRPAKYANAAERQAAWRAANAVKTLALDGKVAPTVEKLAEAFDCTQTEVVNHLLRFALANRNWVGQGMTGWEKSDRRYASGKRPVATLTAEAEEGLWI